jgi:DNA-binding transcriptional regulator GbsR (MarR family)
MSSPGKASSSVRADESLARGQQQFIELWSQMAGNWGVPKSMAEVHALLFIVGRPMTAEEIMERLDISRGGASMTLRSLVDWGIVTREHCKVDRKDLYAAEQDVRTLFATVICARKRREIDPLVGMLRECREITRVPPRQADRSDAALDEHNRKLDQMLDFVQAFDELTSRLLAGGGCGLEACVDALKGLK